MAIKYTNIFHCKTLQNLPKLEFLVSNHLATLAFNSRLLFSNGQFGSNLSVEIIFAAMRKSI
jgi:hypothetical protein